MKRIALLVGVDKYNDPSISPLQFAGADVRSMAERLRGRCAFDHVRLLAHGPDTDGEPDWGTVSDCLDGLVHDLRADDLFVFFFSGHGVEINDRAYLLTQDVRQKTPERGLSMDHLRDWLERIEARTRVLLIDACRNDPRSGRGDADNRMGDAMSKDIIAAANAGTSKGHNVTTASLSACRVGQRAYEWPAKGHGVFTHFLLEGIDGAAWDANGLTLRPLARYACENVRRWSGLTVGAEQEPWYQEFGVPETIVLCPAAAASGAEAASIVRPASARARSGGPVVLARCGGSTYRGDLSLGGRFAATKGNDGTVRVWDVFASREIWRCAPGMEVLRRSLFSLSGDGRLMAALTWECVEVWEWQLLGARRRWRCEFDNEDLDFGGWPYSVCFSPDSAWLAGCSMDEKFVFDAFTGRVIDWPSDAGPAADSVRFLPGGNAVRCSHRVAHMGTPDCVCFTPDGGTLLLSNSSYCFECPEPEFGGEEVNQNLTDDCSIVCCAANGRYALRAEGSWMQVYDMARLRPLFTLKGHRELVQAADISPDGRYAASASEDNTFRIWSIQTGGCVRCIEFHERSSGISCVRFAGDGRSVLTIDYGGTIRQWPLDWL